MVKTKYPFLVLPATLQKNSNLVLFNGLINYAYNTIYLLPLQPQFQLIS